MLVGVQEIAIGFISIQLRCNYDPSISLVCGGRDDSLVSLVFDKGLLSSGAMGRELAKEDQGFDKVGFALAIGAVEKGCALFERKV